MAMSLETGITLQLALLMCIAAFWLSMKSWQLWHGLHQASPDGESKVSVSPMTLTGAGEALAHPPADLLVTLDRIKQYGDYTIPLGWKQSRDGIGTFCVSATLTRNVQHILLTGKSMVDKDNTALFWLLPLLLTHAPEQVQLCVLDGKGSMDWRNFAGKAHSWLLASDEGDIAGAMRALTTERLRRKEALLAARLAAWEDAIGKRQPLPLLVVYISELVLLERVVGTSELEDWLEAELYEAGACGIRYIIGTRTAAHFSPQWQEQIDLFAAGCQPAPYHDEPNTRLTSDEVRLYGAVPPSDIPGLPTGQGVLTLAQGTTCYTVRAPFLRDEMRLHWLAQLPESTLPIHQSATEKSVRRETAMPGQATIPAAPRRTRREQHLEYGEVHRWRVQK